MNWPNAARYADEKAPGRGFFGRLGIIIVGGLDGGVESIETAVRTLGERIVAAACKSFFRTRRTFIKLDSIGKIGEFAVGFEIVRLDGLKKRHVFYGAVVHKEEKSFAIAAVAEVGEENVNRGARKTKIRNALSACFVGVEVWVIFGGTNFFNTIPVEGESSLAS